MTTAYQLFQHISHFPCTPEQLYDWHNRQGALARLLPPWEKIAIVNKDHGIAPGTEVKLTIAKGPFGLFVIPFHARHITAEPGRKFQDIQLRGPFSLWRHTHIFEESEHGCQLRDEVQYALPANRILPQFVKHQVENNLRRMFHYRTSILKNDIRLHNRCSQKPMRLLISGSSGVLGRELLPLLSTGGHEIWRLVRRRPDSSAREIFWDPEKNQLDLNTAPRFDGVIHLAGEYIGLHRWTEEKKQKVLNSRIKGTALLIKKLASLQEKPAAFLCASATGYYGDCEKKEITEDQPPGESFIAEVCRKWEQTAAEASAAGMRTVMLRLGIGLTPRGGALQRILNACPFGYIRHLGHGRQMISWISSDDMSAAILHCLSHEITGPVNIVAPFPVTNRVFMKTLAKITCQPRLFPVPGPLLERFYGEMAAEMLLASAHVSCKKLLQSGFQFRHPDLETALRAMLGHTQL